MGAETDAADARRFALRITVEDLETGLSDVVHVPVGEYVLLTTEPCYVSHTQMFGAGTTVQVTIKGSAPAMTALSFGQRLRRLRLATTVTVTRQSTRLRSRYWQQVTTMSQNELAHRAGLDPALVSRLESGTQQWHPKRQTVERLADALGLSPSNRAELLVSAGYWPWPDADDDTTELLVALALAVLDGDERPLEQTVRDGVSAIDHAR